MSITIMAPAETKGARSADITLVLPERAPSPPNNALEPAVEPPVSPATVPFVHIDPLAIAIPVLRPAALVRRWVARVRSRITVLRLIAALARSGIRFVRQNASTSRLIISPTAQVAPTARAGVPYRALQEGEWTRLDRPTCIGERCDIGHFSLIGEEALIGEGSIVDAYCMVDGGVTLGKNVLVTHRASVGAKATIGDNCIIGGTLICEKSTIGDNCRVFGDLIHRQLDPTLSWDAEEAEEPAPHLENNVFIGWGATIIGGVNIGEGSYICAGAKVTKDVPAHHIVTGTNKLHKPEDWNGALGKSPFFAES